MSAAFESLRSLLPSLPNFDFSLFKPKADLPYIRGSIIDNLPVDKKDILEKLLDNLSIESFPVFILYAAQNISLGKQANSIHPFNTFEFFLSTLERIGKTKTIYHKTGAMMGFDHFKAQSIQGFCCFLKARHEKGELIPYLAEFCEKTKKDITLLQSYIDNENFKAFVEAILLNF